MFIVDYLKQKVLLKKRERQQRYFCVQCLRIVLGPQCQSLLEENGGHRSDTENQHRLLSSHETCKIKNLQMHMNLASKHAFSLFYTLQAKRDFFPQLQSLDLRLMGQTYSWQKYVPAPPSGQKKGAGGSTSSSSTSSSQTAATLWSGLRGLRSLRFSMAEVKLDPAIMRVFFGGFDSLRDSLESLDLDLFNNQEMRQDLLIEVLGMLRRLVKLRSLRLNLRRIQSISMNENAGALEAFTQMLHALTQLKELHLNLAQVPDFNEPGAFLAIVDACCSPPKQLAKFAISLQYSGLFNEHLKTIAERLLVFKDSLEEISINFSYNHLGHGCVVPLYETVRKLQRVKKIDLNFETTADTLSQKDLFFINQMGLDLLEKNHFAQISLQVPFSNQQQYAQYEQQFQIMSQLGWTAWKALTVSPVYKFFRVEVSYEILLDFLL